MIPQFLTSWDDGKRQDFQLAQLLKRFSIPAIFFIPSNCELKPDEIKALSDMGFEIGGHTKTHPSDMKLISDEKQFEEIKDNKEWLEGIIGKKIEWFCYPRGRFNDITIKALKECGFKYARMTKVLETKKPEDNFRIATSIHIYPRQEYKEEPWDSVAIRLFGLAYNKWKTNNNGYFHLWGHSWEIEKLNLWNELEDFFEYIEDYRDFIDNNKKYEDKNNRSDDYTY